ncbi:12888_t:CDS:1, partial [Gigaspora rosea]
NPPKKLKASVENENAIHKKNWALKDHTGINVMQNNSTSANNYRRKCGG